MTVLEGELVETESRALVEADGYRLASEAVAAFLEALDVRPSSKETYRRQLEQFLSWLHKSRLMDAFLLIFTAPNQAGFDERHILAYKQYLQDIPSETTGRPRSAYSVNGYLTAVRRFFAWLEKRKLYPNVAKVKGLEPPEGHRKEMLTPAQIREALATFDKGSLEGLRDYGLFMLAVSTGLRVVELSRAQVGDMRPMSGETVLYVQGKGKSEKDAFVVLVPRVEKALRDYLKARASASEEQALFISHSNRSYGQPLARRTISGVIKGALRAIGLDDKRMTAHSLRHTSISLAIQGGASLHQAQAMARHKDPATTMVYFHNLDRLQHAAERCVQF